MRLLKHTPLGELVYDDSTTPRLRKRWLQRVNTNPPESATPEPAEVTASANANH